MKSGELKPKAEQLSPDGQEFEQIPDGALMYQYSTTVEKEKPELDEVTRQLIASYRKNPMLENYDLLWVQVGINYDKVLAKKQAKPVNKRPIENPGQARPRRNPNPLNDTFS